MNLQQELGDQTERSRARRSNKLVPNYNGYVPSPGFVTGFRIHSRSRACVAGKCSRRRAGELTDSPAYPSSRGQAEPQPPLALRSVEPGVSWTGGSLFLGPVAI
jgi:hypothetical protein